jgi:hypothetical protein
MTKSHSLRFFGLRAKGHHTQTLIFKKLQFCMPRGKSSAPPCCCASTTVKRWWMKR